LAPPGAPARAELDCERDGTRATLVRSLRPHHRKLLGEGEEPVTSAAGVTARLEGLLRVPLEVLGELSFVDQGRIADFLVAPPAMRTAMAQHLFGLGKVEAAFRAVNDRLLKVRPAGVDPQPRRERVAALEREVSELRASLDLAPPAPEYDAADEALLRASERRPELERALHDLQARTNSARCRREDAEIQACDAATEADELGQRLTSATCSRHSWNWTPRRGQGTRRGGRPPSPGHMVSYPQPRTTAITTARRSMLCLRHLICRLQRQFSTGCPGALQLGRWRRGAPQGQRRGRLERRPRRPGGGPAATVRTHDGGPAMGETRPQLKARLEAAGVWPEFVALRDPLAAGGLTPAQLRAEALRRVEALPPPPPPSGKGGAK
jgi:hypothetical protein